MEVQTLIITDGKLTELREGATASDSTSNNRMRRCARTQVTASRES